MDHQNTFASRDERIRKDSKGSFCIAKIKSTEGLEGGLEPLNSLNHSVLANSTKCWWL